MPTSDHPAVDTVRERSVSFPRDPSLARDPRLLESQLSISVVPGRGPTPATLTAALVRDVMALGTDGAVFVLDDYHTVDESPDVKSIVGELIAHAPERVTFIFASRRLPSIRVARLRALGEVAELSTDD